MELNEAVPARMPGIGIADPTTHGSQGEGLKLLTCAVRDRLTCTRDRVQPGFNDARTLREGLGLGEVSAGKKVMEGGRRAADRRSDAVGGGRSAPGTAAAPRPRLLRSGRRVVAAAAAKFLFP